MQMAPVFLCLSAFILVRKMKPVNSSVRKYCWSKRASCMVQMVIHRFGNLTLLKKIKAKDSKASKHARDEGRMKFGMRR